nr:MAG TPA: HTH-type transcriptional regulator [Caudoviricetes sp.]
MAQGVKTISKKKFFEAFDAFCSGRMTLSVAARHIGISVPTASKYFNMYIKSEPFPDTLFGTDEQQEIRNQRAYCL